MKILHLNLYRKYFDAIVNGTKIIEYRDKTDYWKKRIEGREYDIIKFRNGYATDAPTMLAEYNGYKVYWDDGAQVTPPYDQEIISAYNSMENFNEIK